MLKNISVNENEPVGAERFVIMVSDFKQSMGLWYSLFARKILPVLLYFIPINVVLEQVYLRINRMYPNNFINSTFLLVTWIVAMLLLIASAVLAPKAATAIEFVFGFAFLFFALRYSLVTNALGYTVLIGLIIFLLIKLLFLVFEIIRLKTFAGDKKNRIERDESGRVIRASDEEVFFTKEDNNENNTPAVNEEVFFTKEDNNVNNAPAVNDDVYFTAENNADNNEIAADVDDDFFFG